MTRIFRYDQIPDFFCELANPLRLHRKSRGSQPLRLSLNLHSYSKSVKSNNPFNPRFRLFIPPVKDLDKLHGDDAHNESEYF